MHKDHLNGQLGSQPKSDYAERQNQQCQPRNATPKEVTVLDDFPLYADPESTPTARPLSQEAENLKLFKVFIKRNLPHQKPAPDLLVRIHQRIDAVKKESMK